MKYHRCNSISNANSGITGFKTNSMTDFTVGHGHQETLPSPLKGQDVTWWVNIGSAKYVRVCMSTAVNDWLIMILRYQVDSLSPPVRQGLIKLKSMVNFKNLITSSYLFALWWTCFSLGRAWHARINGLDKCTRDASSKTFGPQTHSSRRIYIINSRYMKN